MKKAALIAAVLFAFAFAMAQADGTTMSYADARAEAAKLDKPLLVDFFTTW